MERLIHSNSNESCNHIKVLITNSFALYTVDSEIEANSVTDNISFSKTLIKAYYWDTAEKKVVHQNRPFGP